MFGCHTITKGNPNHRSLVFFHGLFGCNADWKPLIAQLEHKYHCVILDLPGHGQTPYREEILNSFREELQKTQLKPVLIGYSMGGRMALQLREYSSAVIAISAHPGLKTAEDRQAQREKEAKWKTKLLELPSREFFTQWYAQPLFDSLKERPDLLATLLQNRIGQDVITLAQVLSQLSLASQDPIDSFPTSTLLIHGKKDSKYQQLYHNMRLPVCSIENAGHTCLIENPQSCGLAILNWLERLHANDQ